MEDAGLAPLVAWVLMIFTFIYIAHGCITRKMELIGFPIMFHGGMIQFYFLSVALLAFFNIGEAPYRPSGEGFNTLAWLMPLFVVVYMFFEKRGRTGRWGERYFPKADYACTTPGLLVAFGVMAGITGATFLLAGTGYSDQLLFQLRPTFAAAMVGFAACLVASNPWNPVYWVLLAVSVPPGLVAAATYSSGRTTPLSVLLVIPWVFYYLRLRYRSVAHNAAILGTLCFLALVFLFAYSNIRHEYAGARASFEARQEQLSGLLETENSVFMEENIKAVFLQDTPIVSVLCIELYGSQEPLQPFHGVMFFLSSPIPRFLWENKPVAMGIQIQDLVSAPGNLSIGIIGHGWVEGMVVGVIGYAVFFGLLVGYFDRIMRHRATNPYLVAILGSTNGQFLCVPRGETFQNLALMVSGWIVCWAALGVVNLAFGPFLRGFKTLDFGPPADSVLPDEDQQQAVEEWSEDDPIPATA